MRHGKDIFNIFKTKGLPNVTYVKRKNGIYEKQVSNALSEKGTCCLITGPSKTGKTTLYTKVITNKGRTVLRIVCNSKHSVAGIWSATLEYLQYERITNTLTSKGNRFDLSHKLKAKLKLPYFTNIEGGISMNAGRKSDMSVTKERVLSEPSAHHIANLLKVSNHVLVLDGVHRLNPSERKIIFEQVRDFVEAEISIIIVATTHHIDELSMHNAELSGRYSHIRLRGWDIDDLCRIVSQGFLHLKVPLPADDNLKMIARQSVGLPIITQSACLEILKNKLNSKRTTYSISQTDIFAALHNIALKSYSGFEAIYACLTKSSQQKANYYSPLKFILTAFSLDPIVFSLSRDELEERIKRINVPHISPRSSSITKTLNSLNTLQKQINCELLQWTDSIFCLEILEPSFLFYLRWRENRNVSPTPDQILNALLENEIKAMNSKRGVSTESS